MKLPIADCRLPISSACGGFAQGGHDGGQIVCFLQQRRQFAGGDGSRFGEQFKPEGGFIGFFFDDANFRDEFRFAASSACGPVIRRQGSSAADDLFCNDASHVIGLGNRARQFNDAKRKVFGSLFQFGWVQGAKLSSQSATGNRQSAMAL